ncbi:MAG: DUF1722 domain-containing protein [Pseudodesulfovibrio sp.]
MSETINIGVSACTLGEKVRCNGSHSLDTYLTETLAKYVKFTPACPEVACGMNIPRERLRQVDCADDVRLITAQSAEDWTDRMHASNDGLLDSLGEEKLDGFILKRESTSCALSQGKIHSTSGKTPRLGPGFFTQRLMQRFPLLPLEANQRLQNPIIRENFIRRIFVYKRWCELLGKGMQIGQLVDFHTRHEMLIRAHDLNGYRQLSKLLGESSIFNNEEIFGTYGEMLFKSLMLTSTPRKNSDVLMHAMGYFKNELSSDDKSELSTMINTYKSGKTPLLVPVTMINHHARKYEKTYLQLQFFLNPNPAELKMLYHV